MLKSGLCEDAANEGIKDWLKAPSAKMLRNRFGSLKAIKNISLYTPAPRTLAVSISRKNPSTLEVKIPAEFVKIDLNIARILSNRGLKRFCALNNTKITLYQFFIRISNQRANGEFIGAN